MPASAASSGSPRPTPITTTQTRREQILDAALVVFVERGFLGATMDDIGEAVGMRAPSLYKHVRNKQELLAALMSRSIADVHRSLESAVASTDDPVLRLRRAFEAHVRYHAVHRLDALLGAKELANLEPGPLRERILGERDRYEATFTGVLRDGVEAGVFDLPRPKIVGLALLDLGSGVAVWFRDDGELSVDQLVYQYSDLALRLVGGTARPGASDQEGPTA